MNSSINSAFQDSECTNANKDNKDNKEICIDNILVKSIKPASSTYNFQPIDNPYSYSSRTEGRMSPSSMVSNPPPQPTYQNII